MALSLADGRGRIADINVTPMADVMIVLLIIFMVTVPIIRDGPVANLPDAAHARVESEGAPVVSVSGSGALFIDGLPMLSLDDLQLALQSSLANRADKTVHVKAEPDLDYVEVGRVLQACRRAGAQSVALVTKPRIRSAR
jgi:biopolymer transport protein TolR